jgi:hypothetical protein
MWRTSEAHSTRDTTRTHTPHKSTRGNPLPPRRIRTPGRTVRPCILPVHMESSTRSSLRSHPAHTLCLHIAANSRFPDDRSVLPGNCHRCHHNHRIHTAFLHNPARIEMCTPWGGSRPDPLHRPSRRSNRPTKVASHTMGSSNNQACRVGYPNSAAHGLRSSIPRR